MKKGYTRQDAPVQAFSLFPKPNFNRLYGHLADERLISASDPVRRWNKFRPSKKNVTLPDKPFDWSGK